MKTVHVKVSISGNLQLKVVFFRLVAEMNGSVVLRNDVFSVYVSF